MIIICQNCESSETMELIREVLPADMLVKFFNVEGCKDQKLSDIGLYLKGLIYKETEQSAEATEESKTSQAASQLSQAEALKAKKAAAAKKKAALLAKMKKKQSNFIVEPVVKKVVAPANKNDGSVDATMTQDND